MKGYYRAGILKILASALIPLLILNSCTKSTEDSVNPGGSAAFTIAADSIKLNPSGYNPLAAQVSFLVATAGKTFIRVRGKHGKLTDVEHTFNDNGTKHSVPVIGLYPNYNNTVDVRIVNAAGDTLAKSTIKIQTGEIPPNMPTVIAAASFDETKVNPGLLLVSNFSNFGTKSPYIPYFMDNYGEVRWLLDYRNHPELKTLAYECGISRLRNGNFYFGDNGQTDSKIYEVDLLGKVLNSWRMPGYVFHHEVSEKPNGNFVLTATKPGSTYKNGNPTTDDFVIEIDRKAGTIATVWDLKESLDETRAVLATDGLPPVSDWFHGNAVKYDSTDNTIIVSGRLQGITKLDYNNRVKWILSPHKGWTKNRRGEDLTAFLLKPLDATGKLITDAAVLEGTKIAADFEWNWYQHNNTFLPNGDIMLFDNGSTREFVPLAPKYSRVVTYKIDPAKLTVQQTWAYGKERGTETFSLVISGAQFLPQTNHVLFTPGFLVPNTTGSGGKIVEVDFVTKKVISEISVSSTNGFGFHRVVKMSAYP